MMKTVEEIMSYRDGIYINALYSDTYLFSNIQEGQLCAIRFVFKNNIQPKELRSVAELKAYRDGIKSRFGGKPGEYSDKQQGMLKAIDWILDEGAKG